MYVLYTTCSSSRLSTGLSRTPRSRRDAPVSWPRVTLTPASTRPKIPFPHARTRLRKNFPKKSSSRSLSDPDKSARRLTFTQMLPRSIKLPIACADFAPSLWPFQTLPRLLTFCSKVPSSATFYFQLPAVVLDGPAPHPPCRVTSEPLNQSARNTNMRKKATFRPLSR